MQLVLFHIFLLPIILSTYYLNKKNTNYFINAVCLITVIYTIIRKDAGYLAIIPVYYLASMLTYKFKLEEERNKEILNEALEEAESSYQELISKKNALEEKNRKIEEEIEEISELYEVAKDLNETLDPKKTLDIIGDSLDEVFEFSDAKIILVKEDKSIATVYPVRKNLSNREPRIDIKEISSDPLVRYSLSSLIPITLNEGDIEKRLKHPSDIKSFTSVPLMVANELLGIITMTDAKLKHTEEDLLSRLCILSAQYALEISKARLYEKLQSLAITDGLTRVTRRYHFQERYNEEVSRSKRHNLNLSVLMIDIDHFKNFNERYGHLYGDAVLIEVARILKQGIREVDLLCRYGGEEFVIMLPETTKPQAKIVAERLRQNIAQDKFQAYGESATLTISIGIASLPEDTTEGQELIDKADEALLRAKREGRNCVCLY